MHKLALAAAVAASFLAVQVAHADDTSADDDQSPSFWMKQKLTYSQQILHGLVTEDYGLIRDNALAMQGLNRIEHFVRRQPKGYRTRLTVFQHSVEELLREAEERNLEGATLAFTQMTLSCVQCHERLRKE